MSTPLTRETFISSNYVKIAAAQAIMFKTTSDGEGVEEVPVPENVRETGIIPEGYSVDFVLDPSIIVASLQQQGITTVEQLPAEALQDFKDAINAPENLTIVPTSVHVEKRALETTQLEEE